MPTLDKNGNVVKDATDEAQGGAKAWFIANPNGKLLFTIDISTLGSEIDGLDLSTLPTPTANKIKLLLKTLSVSVKVLARKEKLI